MVFKITESMHGVAVPPTLYSQYNVVVYLCRKKPSLSDPTRRGVRILLFYKKYIVNTMMHIPYDKVHVKARIHTRCKQGNNMVQKNKTMTHLSGMFR